MIIIKCLFLKRNLFIRSLPFSYIFLNDRLRHTYDYEWKNAIENVYNS